jgi:hypothetical protein
MQNVTQYIFKLLTDMFPSDMKLLIIQWCIKQPGAKALQKHMSYMLNKE